MEQQNGDWLNVRLVIWILGGLGAIAIAGGMVLIGLSFDVPDAVWLIGTNAVTAVATMLTQGRTGQRRHDGQYDGQTAEPVPVVGKDGGPVEVTETPAETETKNESGQGV